MPSRHPGLQSVSPRPCSAHTRAYLSPIQNSRLFRQSLPGTRTRTRRTNSEPAPAQAQGLSKQAKGMYVRGVLTRDCDPPVSRVVRAPRPTLQPLPRGTWLPTPRGRTPSALWDPAVSQSRTSGRDGLRRGRRKHHRRRRITHARGEDAGRGAAGEDNLRAWQAPMSIQHTARLFCFEGRASST